MSMYPRVPPPRQRPNDDSPNFGDHLPGELDLILTRIVRTDDGHISTVTYEHDRLRDLVSPRTYYALRRNGFYHPDQVRDTSDEELLSCQWIGQKSLYEIRRALG